MNNLRKTLTWVMLLSLTTVGLETSSIAIATQVTDRVARQSAFESEPNQNTTQERIIAVIGCASVITKNDPLTIRSGPGKRFSSIGSVDSGQAVEVFRRNNGPRNSEAWHWVYIRPVRYPIEGWVHSDFLSPISECQGIGG